MEIEDKINEKIKEINKKEHERDSAIELVNKTISEIMVLYNELEALKTNEKTEVEDIPKCRKIYAKIEKGGLTTKEYRKLQKELIDAIDSIEI